MKNMGLKKAILLLVILTVLLPASAFASGRGGGRPQGPPPEAIAACEGKSVGDSVEFEGRRGDTVEATCKEIEGQIVAFPNNMPEGGPGRN